MQGMNLEIVFPNVILLYNQIKSSVLCGSINIIHAHNKQLGMARYRIIDEWIRIIN